MEKNAEQVEAENTANRLSAVRFGERVELIGEQIRKIEKEIQNQVRRVEELEKRKAAARGQARRLCENVQDSPVAVIPEPVPAGSEAPEERKAGKPEPAGRSNDMGQGLHQGMDQGSAKERNRGRFRKGDHRINRLGRALRRVPTLAEKVEKWDRQGPCPACDRQPAPRTGPLMKQILSEKELRQRLTMTTPDSSYVVHLPDDAKIVAIELDAAQGVVVVTYCSERFRPVAAGEPIKELVRAHFGQQPKWW